MNNSSNNNNNNNNNSDPSATSSASSSSSSRPTHPLASSHHQDSSFSFDDSSSQEVSQSTQTEMNGNRSASASASDRDPSSSGGAQVPANESDRLNGSRTGVRPCGENGNDHTRGSTNRLEQGRAPLEDLDEGKFKPMFQGSSIDRREFIRLTLQSLKDLGYQQTAASLELESGLQLESPSITSFRQAVLNGDWKICEKLLLKGLKEAKTRVASRTAKDEESLTNIGGNGDESDDLNSVLRDPASKGLDWIKFILHQQRYLELLESRQTKKALEVLRKRLAPLAIHFGTDRLHQLSSLVVCATPEELKSRAGWDGSGGNSRREVLYQIEGAVTPQVMIPSRRLPRLLEQAQTHQKLSDPFYNQVSDQPLSLYVDHVSSRSVFPTHNAKEDVLLGHEDEVWHLEWNHRGDALASCGKDGWVIIWKFRGGSNSGEGDEDEDMQTEKDETLRTKQDQDTEMESENGPPQNGNGKVEEGEKERDNISNGNGFSHGSSSNSSPSLVDAISQIKLYKKLGPHSGSITWLAWSPDDTQILAASDTDILLFDVERETSKTFKGHAYTVGTVVWMPDGKSFVTGGMDGKVNVWSLAGTSSQTITTYPFRIRTLAVSPDSRHLIILSWRATPSVAPASSSNPTTSAADSRNGSSSSSKDPSPRTGVGMAEGDNLAGGSREMGNLRQQLHFYDLIKKQERGSVYFSEQMHSVTISRDSKFALINQRPNETQLWDIDSRTALARYVGHKVEQDVIGNCFGGATGTFVVTGSEDACIYVYHRASGKLIEKLSGHEEGSVNAVSWHPSLPSIFASCGDDQTVRIWRPAPSPSSKVALSPLRMTTPSSTKQNSNGNSSSGHGSRNHNGNASESGESSSNGHNGSNPFPWASSPLHRGSPSPIHSPIFQILSNSASSPPLEEDQDDEDRDEDDEDEDDDDENMEEDEEVM